MAIFLRSRLNCCVFKYWYIEVVTLWVITSARKPLHNRSPTSNRCWSVVTILGPAKCPQGKTLPSSNQHDVEVRVIAGHQGYIQTSKCWTENSRHYLCICRLEASAALIRPCSAQRTGRQVPGLKEGASPLALLGAIWRRDCRGVRLECLTIIPRSYLEHAIMYRRKGEFINRTPSLQTLRHFSPFQTLGIADTFACLALAQFLTILVTCGH